jgi:hypothetical protein
VGADAALIAWWAALHGAAPGLWSPELRALDAPLLSWSSCTPNGCTAATARVGGLRMLTSAPPSFEGTQFGAHLHSCVC